MKQLFKKFNSFQLLGLNVAEVEIILNEIIMNYICPSMFLAFIMHFCVLFLTVTMMVSHTEIEYICSGVYGMATRGGPNPKTTPNPRHFLIITSVVKIHL